MLRREFVKLTGCIAAAAGGASLGSLLLAADETDERRLLDPLDLLGRIRLGQNALLGGLDSSRHHLPYWNCGFDKGDLTGFNHSHNQGDGVWDRIHDVGRALHGLSMAESVTGDRIAPVIVDDLAHYLIDLFKAGDGLPGDMDPATGKRFVHLHNIREALNGLTALIKRGHPEAERLARQMVRVVRRSLDDTGRLHLDRLPPYVEGYNYQPSNEGRSVDALVRYYRVSRDESALEAAMLITRFALEHCFSEAGALTWEAGTHGHSINALVAGMIDLALATNDAVLLERARRAYDVGLPSFNSSFGWSMESLHKPRLKGESNNTGDILRATLLLGKAGFHDYYGRAERILRGHLLPSQFVDSKHYSDDPAANADRLRRVASRVRGGFSFPTPNDYQFQPDAPVFTYDITSGATDALCETYRGMVEENANEVRLHLLLSIDTKNLGIKSFLSREGRIEVDDRAGRSLWVRIPGWVRRADLSVRSGGSDTERRFVGPYLLLDRGQAGQNITIHFPVHKERTVESIVYQPFTIDWQGDQIVAMSPPSVSISIDQAPLPRPCMPIFPRCR